MRYRINFDAISSHQQLIALMQALIRGVWRSGSIPASAFDEAELTELAGVLEEVREEPSIRFTNQWLAAAALGGWQALDIVHPAPAPRAEEREGACEQPRQSRDERERFVSSASSTAIFYNL